jgi:hypothetical protein
MIARWEADDKERSEGKKEERREKREEKDD